MCVCVCVCVNMHTYIYIYIYIWKKLATVVEGDPKTLFNSNYIGVYGSALLLSLDYSALPLIYTL